MGVFWFWLGSLVLLWSSWRERYMLYMGSYCGSLTGSKGSDNRESLSSIV